MLQLVEKDNMASFRIPLKVADTTSDIFGNSGKVGGIYLKTKLNGVGHKMRLKIGQTQLTEKELIDEADPYMQEGEIGIGCNIDFKSNDKFEFEQPSDNISEIQLWISELQRQ